MTRPTALCVLLLCTAHALVLPTSAVPDHWTSFYHRTFAGRQQAAQQCDAVSPASLACQSARLTVGGNNTHIHVCPKGDGNVCYNSKLPRCCPTDVTRGLLKCVSTTKLTVSGQQVTVKIYEASATPGHCIHFDTDIESCCLAAEKVLKCPEPTVRCEPVRDVFFVLDATQSIGDDIFCRFGYVLQLIEAAINPRGINGARVATVLFENDIEDVDPGYLFNLDDRCETVVSTNIRKVVYEYYAVRRGLPRSSLTYPQVDSRSTTPFSALVEVEKGINRNRNTSIIILTDGKPQQDIPSTGIINDLSKISDVIIAAGIGSQNDINEVALRDLVTDPNNVVYEPDTGKVIDFAKRIVEKMNRTGALCPTEATSILNALDRTQTGDTIDNYCINCMWKSTPDANCQFPTCGAQTLEIQSVSNVGLKQEVDTNELFAKEWEKLLLEGEIAKAVESVIAKVKG